MAGQRRVRVFTVEDGQLVYDVTPIRGRAYTVRCPQPILEEITFLVEESGAAGLVGMDIVQKTKATYSQACAALAFLEDCGCILRQRRRCQAVSSSVHLEAMSRFHALAHKADEGPGPSTGGQTPYAARDNGLEAPVSGTTFDYHVTVEWAGNIERRTLNRIGDICDVVACTLADMGVIDVEEPPDPNIARITIERAGTPSIHDLPKTESPEPKADAGKGA